MPTATAGFDYAEDNFEKGVVALVGDKLHFQFIYEDDKGPFCVWGKAPVKELEQSLISRISFVGNKKKVKELFEDPGMDPKTEYLEARLTYHADCVYVFQKDLEVLCSWGKSQSISGYTSTKPKGKFGNSWKGNYSAAQTKKKAFEVDGVSFHGATGSTLLLSQFTPDELLIACGVARKFNKYEPKSAIKSAPGWFEGSFIVQPPTPPQQMDLVWKDFGVPEIAPLFWKSLVEQCKAAKVDKVTFFCMGGKGRTGTSLSCVAVASGKSCVEAVKFVRKQYWDHAVETDSQLRYIALVDKVLNGNDDAFAQIKELTSKGTK